MIEIGTVCGESPFSCFKQLFLVFFALAMCIMSSHCMYQLVKIMKRLSYELLPLASCLIQSIMHLIMFLFYTDNRMQIVTAYFCLYTYLFVAQSFVYLYYKLNYTISQFKSTYRWVLFLSVLAVVTLTGLTIACIVVVNPHQCDKYFHMGISFQLFSMLISSIVCWWYGINLQEHIKDDNQDYYLTQTSLNSTLLKQISTVVKILVASSSLFFVLLLFQILAFDNLLCRPQTDALNLAQNLFMIFFSVVEMTPCLAIPYVFYYLPSAKEQPHQEQITFEYQHEAPTHQEQEFTNIVKQRLSEQFLKGQQL